MSTFWLYGSRRIYESIFSLRCVWSSRNTHLLWTHVEDGPANLVISAAFTDERACFHRLSDVPYILVTLLLLRQFVFPEGRHETEVADLHRVIQWEKNIRWFQITMNLEERTSNRSWTSAWPWLSTSFCEWMYSMPLMIWSKISQACGRVTLRWIKRSRSDSGWHSSMTK